MNADPTRSTQTIQLQPDDAIKVSLGRIEEALDAAEHSNDPEMFDLLDEEFHRLHARIRSQDAVERPDGGALRGLARQISDRLH